MDSAVFESGVVQRVKDALPLDVAEQTEDGVGPTCRHRGCAVRGVKYERGIERDEVLAVGDERIKGSRHL